jgi:hypothetical protein
MSLRKTATIFLAAAMFASGCNAAGALWYKVAGAPPVPAKYEPIKQPTLVLVENYRNPALTEFDADRVARAVNDDLKKNDVAPLIDHDQLLALRDADPDKFRSMTIPSVGRAVGAKQVIYVDLIESEVQGDASRGVVRGKTAARVRVVDVETGQTLWPVDAQAGAQVGSKVPYAELTESSANEVHDVMLTSLSEQIGRLFHKWKPDTLVQGDEATGS